MRHVDWYARVSQVLQGGGLWFESRGRVVLQTAKKPDTTVFIVHVDQRALVDPILLWEACAPGNTFRHQNVLFPVYLGQYRAVSHHVLRASLNHNR